jgi:hypothetical protein
MKWDTDGNGDIVLCPVLGFHIAPASEMSVVARIEFARSEEQLRAGGEAVQFVLTPDMASQLADDLRKVADHIVSLPRPPLTN